MINITILYKLLYIKKVLKQSRYYLELTLILTLKVINTIILYKPLHIKKVLKQSRYYSKLILISISRVVTITILYRSLHKIKASRQSRYYLELVLILMSKMINIIILYRPLYKEKALKKYRYYLKLALILTPRIVNTTIFYKPLYKKKALRQSRYYSKLAPILIPRVVNIIILYKPLYRIEAPRQSRYYLELAPISTPRMVNIVILYKLLHIEEAPKQSRYCSELASMSTPRVVHMDYLSWQLFMRAMLIMFKFFFMLEQIHCLQMNSAALPFILQLRKISSISSIGFHNCCQPLTSVVSSCKLLSTLWFAQVTLNLLLGFLILVPILPSQMVMGNMLWTGRPVIKLYCRKYIITALTLCLRLLILKSYLFIGPSSNLPSRIYIPSLYGPFCNNQAAFSCFLANLTTRAICFSFICLGILPPKRISGRSPAIFATRLSPELALSAGCVLLRISVPPAYISTPAIADCIQIRSTKSLKYPTFLMKTANSLGQHQRG